MANFLEDSWHDLDESSAASSFAVRRSLELHEYADLEEVMYCLETLAGIKSEDPAALPFLPRIRAKYSQLDSLPEFDQVREQAIEAREHLRRVVYEKCSSFDGEVAWATLSRLFQSLNVYCEPKTIYVATTNYDRIIESLWEGREDGLYAGQNPIELKTGFYNPPYGRPYFDVERGYLSKDLQGPVVHLIKLHGSLGWREYEPGRVEDTGAREYSGPHTVLAYPVRKSKTEDEPFNQLFEYFDRAILNSNLIIIIGHSMRDQAILNRISDALRTRRKLCIIIDQASEHVRNRFPPDVRGCVAPYQRRLEEVELTSPWHWGEIVSGALEWLPSTVLESEEDPQQLG